MNFCFRIFVLLGSFGVFSCSPENTEQVSAGWINMDSLIAAQIPHGVAIEKRASLDSSSSSGSVTIKENWSEELASFARIGIINKPIYRNLYHKEIGPDPNSNLNLLFLSATDSTAPIRQLKILYRENPKEIIRLDAVVKESSLFYSKEETLSMEFDPHTKRLERYTVDGWQQMAWFKPETYRIAAHVRYTEAP